MKRRSLNLMSFPAARQVAALMIAALFTCRAHATTATWWAPVARQVAPKPGAAVVGTPVTITCIIGTQEKTTVDTNAPLGKYLAGERKPSWTLPVEIQVDGVTISEKDWPGLASATSTWKQAATWTPGEKHAGQQVNVQCLVDKDKKLLFSSASAAFSVLAKSSPRLNSKHQPPPTVLPIPGGPKMLPASAAADGADSKPLKGSLPDITSRPMIGVGGKSVAWGDTVTVDAKHARSFANGRCAFTFEHFALNAGGTSTGTFWRRWRNDGMPDAVVVAYPAIGPGEYLRRVDTLWLNPGANHLTMALDNTGAVVESQENNNQFKITVQVDDACGHPDQPVPLGTEFEKIRK